MVRILIAADLLGHLERRRIHDAAEGWAAVVSIPQDAPEAVYREQLLHADIVLGWPRPDWLEASTVRYLQLPSIGFDAYGGASSHGAGLDICNAQGAMATVVAEHALMLMLALARRLPEHLREAASARWFTHRGHVQLAGARACIVGLGGVGTAIARRLRFMEMRTIGVRHDARKPHSDVDSVVAFSDLDTAVAGADWVVAALPHTPDTVAVLDARVFAAMAQGAFFVNVGRGQTVDEAALVDALRSRHLGGAGLDVFTDEPLPAGSPLWLCPNTIITPHVAGRSLQEGAQLCDLFIRNLTAWRAGAPLENRVSFECRQPTPPAMR